MYGRMRGHLLEGSYIHADETEVQVLREEGRAAAQKSRMWVFRSGARDVPCVVYVYSPTRSKDVAERFLAGWSGYLTTDGYSPYFHLDNPNVTNTACLVHVRRRFVEIVRLEGGDEKAASSGSVALAARRRIDGIFARDARFDGLGADARKEARDRELRPLMEEFEAWAGTELARSVPRSTVCRALSYALRLWPYVENVLLDGNLELDNNAAERAIRPFVIGRKNWLFCNSARGAEASAGVYSIMVTARESGLNQRTYVEWLLEDMPNDPRLEDEGALERYMPWSDEARRRCGRGRQAS